ncbi:MAG: sugar ABC transporter permease [Anaerolineae bacterium]|jgi:raffinose/stachyose/melibiose transport system permease protein|nr:sugar ABC transporter permease [Anaerolineae bacterium]
MTPARRAFPWHILVFLAPACLVYTLFMIYPLLDTLRLSLYAPVPEVRGAVQFVGLANYQTLLTDPLYAPRVQGAIVNNFEFFFIHMFVQNPIGLLLATVLASQFVYGRSVYRTLIFLPTILSFVLVGFIWNSILLHPQWGVVRNIATEIGIQGWFAPWRWAGEESGALTVMSLISVWQYVGIPLMLFLAALVSLPDELIEAARVDGATAWGIFWRIKLPLLLPTIGIVGVLTFVGNFNAFDLIYTVKGGLAGPNFTTDLMATFFHRTFFGFQLQSGNPTMGATIAGVLFVIILGGVMLYLFGFQRRLLRVEY